MEENRPEVTSPTTKKSKRWTPVPFRATFVRPVFVLPPAIPGLFHLRFPVRRKKGNRHPHPLPRDSFVRPSSATHLRSRSIPSQDPTPITQGRRLARRYPSLHLAAAHAVVPRLRISCPCHNTIPCLAVDLPISKSHAQPCRGQQRTHSSWIQGQRRSSHRPHLPSSRRASAPANPPIRRRLRS